MKPIFRAATPDDYPRLREFLIRIFRAGTDDLFLRQEQMHWKYWEPRPDWQGPRSFIVEHDGNIAAHGGVWPMPVRLCEGGGWIPSFNLIDCASDPTYPGLGMAMVRKMAADGEPVWVFGGTPAARAMREAGGFQKVHTVGIHGLPLRPAAMERNRLAFGWRGVARLGRNIKSSLSTPAVPAGWSAVALSAFAAQAQADGEADDAWSGSRFQSSLSIASYYERCPVATMKWWELRRDGKRAGYFCLALTPGQARLVDGRVGDGSSIHWQALAGLAAAQARTEGAHELAAWGAREEVREGLDKAGVRLRTTDDLMLYDRLKRLPAGETFDFHFLHSDRAFLHPGTPAYLW